MPDRNATPVQAMGDQTEGQDYKSYVESLDADGLRQELQGATEFYRLSLKSKSHQIKMLEQVNGELQGAVTKSIEVISEAKVRMADFADLMDYASGSIKMWRRSCYALALVIVLLGCKVLFGGAA